MEKRSLIFVFALTLAFFLFYEWFNSSPPASPPIQTEQVQKTLSPQTPERDTSPSLLSQEKPSSQEEFYVLENAYQQLVFSTMGGALSEINLSLQSKENPNSVVREISFDRALKKDYQSNDLFPLFPYSIVQGEKENASIVKVPKGTLGGYYPLIRRGIVGSMSGQKSIQAPPSLYGLSVVSEEPKEMEKLYRVKRFEKNLIEFELVEPTRKIIKTFSFPKNSADAPYCVDLSIKIEGDARGLWLTSGVPEVELISGSSTPSLKYRLTQRQKAQVEQLDLPKTSLALTSVHPDWVCNSNGFLGIIIDPLSEIGSGFSAMHISGEIDPTRLSLVDAQYDLYPASKYPGYELRLPLRNSGQVAQFRIFAGPFDNGVLKKVDATYSNPEIGYNPNYTSCQSFHGWFAFISEPFAKFLFVLMDFFYRLTHSWGISIILLTVALRIMLYPLNAWSIKSTTRMQEIAPKVAAIQEKYKKEPKRAQMEIMTLYREKGVNPLSGCFPLLIQMPFLIGMFDLLKSTFELRGASFIPHWIDNLTAPDVVFSWNYPILFFGTQFHLLPLILGGVMYLQQKMSSPLPKDKSLLTDQQKQQKMMGNIMVIVFSVMFYHFPSGLNIYWLSSMLLGILQQSMATKQLMKKRLTQGK